MQIIQKINIKKLTLVILIGLAIITSAVLAFTIHNNNLTNATTITNIAPDQGPTTGGTEVTITGTDFMHSIAEWKQISAGGNHTCAIASDDQAYCWGYNNYGQLGNGVSGSANFSPVPVPVDTSGVLAGKTIKSISTGHDHTCAIASDDQAYCWGQNNSGQLGNSSTTDSPIPVAVNTSGVLSGETIKQISSGDGHACVIASDEQVYCWGYNGNGALGNNSTSNMNNPIPVAVNTSGVLAGKTILSISAGDDHTCAIASDDQAYCWGLNYYGELGNGISGYTTGSPAPVPVDTSGVLSGKTIKSILSGRSHTCAIASDDQAYCWGYNTYGQLGNGLSGYDNISSIPVPVDTSGVLSGKTIKSISAGDRRTCATASDDQTYCWGLNYYGQLGNGTTTGSSIPVAVDTSGVLSGLTIKQISDGIDHTCAIASDDQAYCWGYNNYGQLGNGLSGYDDISSIPVAVSTSSIPPVPLITSVKFDNVEATSFTINSDLSITAIAPPHVAGTVDVALTTVNNQIITLAQGYTYRDPMTISGISPDSGSRAGGQTVAITGTGIAPTSLPALKKVAIGSNYRCGISDDAVYCWGNNSSGQLSGSSADGSSIKPVKIPNNTDDSRSALPADAVINDVAINNYNSSSIYVATNKGIFYLNHSSNGLMRKLTSSSSQLPSGASVTKLSADSLGDLICAIASDNNAYCWGANGYAGSLGDGSTASSSVYPKRVSKTNIGTATITDIAVTSDGGCLLASDNNSYCWGRNMSGRLGIGNSSTTSSVNIPTKVMKTSDNVSSQLPANVTITDLAIASSTVCASANDNNVYCWGSGSLGEIGNNSIVATNTLPQKVFKESDGGDSALPDTAAISGVYGSGSRMCATTDSGIYCWGGGTSGSYLTPQKIQDESDNSNSQLPTATTTPIINMAAYKYRNPNSPYSNVTSYCALDATGKIYCWSHGEYAQSYPKRISEMHFSVVFDPTGSPVFCNNISFATNQQSLTCTTSEHRIPGVVDVVVKNGLDAPQTLNQAYEYLAPTLTGISPSSGPTIGGTEITITGTNFIPSDKMIFNSTLECKRSGDLYNTTTMTCITPPGSGYPMTYFYNTNPSDTLQNIGGRDHGDYQYLDPTITSVSPNSGPISGGTEITLTGTNLEGPNGEITLGGSKCIIQNRTNTSITCHTTRHTVGLVDLRLSWAGVDYVSISEAFTYQAPVFGSITPNHGTVDGGTEVIITGDGFGEPSAGYDSSLFAGGSFYTIAGNEITEYSPDGSDRMINTSGIVGNIRQVEAIAANSGNVLLILDDTGMIYVSTQNGAPQALDEIVEQNGSYTYPTGITHLIMGSSPYCYSSDYSSSFPDDTSDTWYSLNCSSLYASGDNGLYGSLYFNYYHVPPSATGYSSYGSFSQSGSALTDCNIDAADSSGFFHCSNDDTIRYTSQTVQTINVTGEFKKFLGNGVMIDGNDRLYKAVYDSQNFEYFYQLLDMSLVTGDNLTPISYSGGIYFVDENNAFYQVTQYDDGTGTGTYIYGLQPYDFANNHSLNLSAVSGTINGLYSNSSSGGRHITTKEGQAYMGTYDSSTGKYIFAPIDTLMPENITSAVVFGSSTEPVECAISSWTDNEIHCTTASHSAGLVSVAVNNGSYNSVKMPAIWADTGKPITDNNYVSNIQSGYYYEAAKITSITPNYGPVGGETNVTISGSGFGEQNADRYEMSALANNSFFMVQNGELIGLMSDGSEAVIDTSSLTGGIRQLLDGELLMVLDGAGIIYLLDPANNLIPFNDLVTNYPTGILNMSPSYSSCNYTDMTQNYPNNTSDPWYSFSCSFNVSGENGLYGSIYFSISQSPSYQDHFGSFYASNSNITCDIDASTDGSLYHCTDGAVYYSGQAVSLANVSGEFDKFLGSTNVMTTKGDNKPYYLDASDSPNYKMMPVDMSQFNGETIVMATNTGYLGTLFTDENGSFYRILNNSIEPRIDFPRSDFDTTLFEGTVNRVVQGRATGSGTHVYFVSTDAGNLYSNRPSAYALTYNHYQIPITIPDQKITSSVMFDRNGTPAECLVTSWSDTETQCSTTEHDAGLVSVSINNGAKHSTEIAATWDNSGVQDRNHITSGFLYEEYYVSISSSEDVSIDITPNINGVFGSATNITSVKTNSLDGYTLTISTDKPSSNTNALDMKHTNRNDYITGTANTCTWNNDLANTTSTIANNTWGFTLNPTNLAAEQLCQVPSSSASLTVKSTTTDNETPAGDQTTFYYGAKIDSTLPAGVYRTKVLYTAVANL